MVIRVSTLILFVSMFVTSSYAQIQELPCPTPIGGSDYGWSSATDGQTLVVGAKSENNDAGAVYVYERNGINWDYAVRLDPNSIDPTDEDFGYSVAVDGDTIVVGATGYNNSQGAIYVFVKDPSNGWGVDPTRFVAGNGNFGKFVAIDSDTIVVGCPLENNDQGAVYVYEKVSNSWSFKQKLEDSDGKGSDDQGAIIDGDRLGRSVSVDDDIIVAGAYYDVVGSNRRQGSVCVFRRSDGIWSQPSGEKIVASNGEELDWFGHAVAISGNVIAAGSPYHDNEAGVSRGCILVFRWDGSQWVQEAVRVSPAEYASSSLFGRSLSLDGDRLAAGEYQSAGYTGSAFLFEWDGNSWSYGTALVTGSSGDRLGSSVAISGDVAFVGAYKVDDGAIADAGMVYIMQLPSKVFNEFQVNSYVNDNQKYPAIAADPNGNSVIVWTSVGQDGDGSGIYGQLFDAYDSRVGDEFHVSTTTDGSQYEADVDMNANGDFIVAWNSWGGDANSDDIYIRRYAANGGPLSGEIKINTYADGRQIYPAVVLNDNGTFIVVWKSFHGNSDWRVAGRLYDAAGNPTTEEFDINQSGSCGEISLAVSDTGDFVVIWITDIGDYKIYARQYNADGTAKGNEFIMFLPENADASLGADLATDGTGNYVLAWHYTTEWPAYEHRDVYGRLYDPNLSPVGDAFMVSTTTTGNQCYPDVSINSNGEFVIAWYGDTDGNGEGVFVRQYDNNAQSIGGEYQLNTYINSDQRAAATVMLESGRFINTWHSDGQDGSGDGVYAAFGPATYLGDFDFDRRISLSDLQILAEGWLNDEPVLDVAPEGGDGVVNLLDFSVISKNWLYGFSNADFVAPAGVNYLDFVFFANHWSDSDCQTSNNCDRTDLDRSGQVDIGDLVLFAEVWLWRL